MPGHARKKAVPTRKRGEDSNRLDPAPRTPNHADTEYLTAAGQRERVSHGHDNQVQAKFLAPEHFPKGGRDERLSGPPVSLVSEHAPRSDLRRPSRGKIARQQRDAAEQQRDADEGGQIDRADSLSGSGYGERSNRALTRLKMAVLTPIPSARVRTIVAVKPGFFRSIRVLYRKS